MTQPLTHVVKPSLHCFPSLHVLQLSSQEHRWLQLPLSGVVGFSVEEGVVGDFAVVVTSVITLDVEVEVVVVVVVVLIAVVIVVSFVVVVFFVVVVVFDDVVGVMVDAVVVLVVVVLVVVVSGQL